MLVLTRKKGERIIVRDDIMITVIEIRGDKVRIGIDAPQHVSVNREEVYLAIAAEDRNRKEAQLKKESHSGKAANKELSIEEAWHKRDEDL